MKSARVKETPSCLGTGQANAAKKTPYLRRLAVLGLAALLLLDYGRLSSSAQDLGRITGVTLGPSNMVRLVVDALLTNSNSLFLQSAGSALGPWRNEPNFSRKPVSTGFEFLTPQQPYYPERFYRFGLFSRSPIVSQMLPYIRLISPNSNLRPGQSFTLLGSNFAPNPGDKRMMYASSAARISSGELRNSNRIARVHSKEL
jgi:hypothetical protein